MKDEREKGLTIGAVVLLNNAEAFVTGVRDLVLAVQDDMVVALLHELGKAIPLRSRVGDLHADVPCAMVLKERVDDERIPDVFSREGGAKLPAPQSEIGFLLL